MSDSYLIDNWQLEDGLPQVSVHAVAQEPEGYLWLATNAGLTRFDGQRFKVFNARNTPELASSLIRALLTDGEGTLWIATRSGLVEHRAGRFRRFTTAQGLPSDDLQTLYLDRQDRLWIGTHDGIARRQGESFEVIGTADGLPHGSVWTLHQDRAGDLWIGTEGGLARLKGDRLETFSVADGLSNEVIFEIYEDREGRLFVATAAAVDGFDGERFEPDPGSRGLRPPVWFFHEDESGRLWAGTDNGLYVRNPRGWQRWSFARGLLEDRVFDLVQDREGSLWVGTGYHGLVRLRPRWIEGVGLDQGLPHHVAWVVLEDHRENMWVATVEGLVRRDQDGQSTVFTVADGLPSGNIVSLSESPDGRLWAGTISGMARQADDGNTADGNTADGNTADGDSTDGPAFIVDPWMEEIEPARVNAMLWSRDGSLWMGSHGGGLWRRRDGELQHLTRRDGLPHNTVRDLVEDTSGTLWIATEGGLGRLPGGDLASARVERYGLAEGLGRELISTLWIDAEDTLWLGTWGGGLHRFQDGALERFTTDDGLFEDHIHSLISDAQGRLWMSGDRGVWTVDQAEVEAFAAGRRDAITAVSYDEYDGMPSRECSGGNQPASWRARDGRLWFPTLEGVAIVDAEHLVPSPLPPPVRVESARADGTRVPVEGRAVLEPGTRLLEIDYTSPTFTAPHKLRFRYRLEGFDDDWQEVGTRRTAFYTNLPHGEYRFRVIARSRDGVWSDPGAVFEIEVLPAFYETRIFWIASALLVLLLGRGVHLYRLRGLLRQNAALARVKRELEAKNAELERFTYAASHDLKSPLFTIHGFLGMLERDAVTGNLERLREDIAHIRTAAVRMRHLLDELLELSRLGRVVQPAENVVLAEVAREAARLVAGQIQERGVEVVIDPALPVVRGERRRLLEVFQNLVDNAVKFMGDQPAPRIEIGVRPPASTRADAEPVIVVRDNGVGIEARYLDKVFGLFEKLDQDDDGTGIGLALVKRIVELHGGRIWVESAGVGKGSAFCFTLPGKGEEGES